MNIRHLGKIITKMFWGKIVMTFIEKRGNIKFKNLKIKKMKVINEQRDH